MYWLEASYTPQVVGFDGGEYVSISGEFNDFKKVRFPRQSCPLTVMSICLHFSDRGAQHCSKCGVVCKPEQCVDDHVGVYCVTAALLPKKSYEQILHSMRTNTKVTVSVSVMILLCLPHRYPRSNGTKWRQPLGRSRVHDGILFSWLTLELFYRNFLASQHVIPLLIHFQASSISQDHQ